MKFCPKCGNKTSRFYEGLCGECSANDIELFSYDPKDIGICVTCNNVHEGKKVFRDDKIRAVTEIVKSKLKFNENIEVSPEIIFDPKPHHVKHGAKFQDECILILRGKTDSGAEIDEEYHIPVTIKYITCEKCSRKNTGYFEGIIQIRGKYEAAGEYLREIMVEQGKRSVFLTNEIEVRNGMDYYITSQRHIKDIGRKIHEKFGGEFKINEQLFTRDKQRSKHLYRVNVLIRLPDYKVGDVVEVDNKILFIKKIKAYLLMGKDLKRNKTITIDTKDKEVTLISSKIYDSTITVIKPRYEVLNPETFQSENVNNEKFLEGKKTGSKVKVIVHNGLWVI